MKLWGFLLLTASMNYPNLMIIKISVDLFGYT